jgi:hypothetical protein
VADIFVYCEVVQLGIISFDIKKFSNLVDWLNRVSVNKHVRDAHWRIREIVKAADEPSLFANIV